jgi:hypothetical protein
VGLSDFVRRGAHVTYASGVTNVEVEVPPLDDTYSLPIWVRRFLKREPATFGVWEMGRTGRTFKALDGVARLKGRVTRNGQETAEACILEIDCQSKSAELRPTPSQNGGGEDKRYLPLNQVQDIKQKVVDLVKDPSWHAWNTTGLPVYHVLDVVSDRKQGEILDDQNKQARQDIVNGFPNCVAMSITLRESFAKVMGPVLSAQCGLRD